MFVIAAHQDQLQAPHRIIVSISDSEATLQTLYDNNTFTSAIITCREQCQDWSWSISNCHIDSLEVYRGRQWAFPIEHRGFSITAERTVSIIISQVTTIKLYRWLLHACFMYMHAMQIVVNNSMYGSEELMGELYRMNLTCQEVKSGCLFFKISGVTDLAQG